MRSSNKLAKLLLALSLPAWATASLAQANVTLYGIIDLNLSQFQSGGRIGGTKLRTVSDGHTNGLNGSRWGIRATEDLGGELRAGAVLEGGILADTGTQAQGGRAFGRQAFVSLAHTAWGELRLGRQYATHDLVLLNNNPFTNGMLLNPGLAVTNAGRPLPQQIDASRIDNMVQYASPAVAGTTLRLQAAPGEGSSDRFHGMMLSHSGGPLALAAGYEWNKDRSTGRSTNKVLTLAGNYDFSNFKLFGGYQKATDLTTNAGSVTGATNLLVTGPMSFTANELKVSTLGVSIPWGQWLLGTNFVQTTYQNASGTSATLGKLGLGVRYALSKNTFIYAAVGRATGDLKEYITQSQVVQAGVRMAF
jgi:general bacterial porin, GBP family